MIPAIEELAGEFGDQGNIHGAGEGHPVARAIAEGGNFTLGIDYGSVAECVERPRGAEARRHDTWLDIPCADGSHHVVTTT